jgi:hypothetical protein
MLSVAIAASAVVIFDTDPSAAEAAARQTIAHEE